MMSKTFALLRKNSFVLLLLAAFVLSDLLISYWDPMVTSRRFYKNDFTKTLYHHGWQNHGPVFYGNSAVTGAYIEQDSRSKLIEMGLSYGKLTDLKAILEQGRFHVEDQLVIGIDVHTMLDILETDPTTRGSNRGTSRTSTHTAITSATRARRPSGSSTRASPGSTPPN